MTSPRIRIAALAVAGLAGVTAAGALAHGEGEGVEAPPGLRLTGVTTRPAPGGAVVHVVTKGFTFAPGELGPEHGSGRNVAGHGHAHLTVDGKSAGLLVAPFAFVALKPGAHTIKVTLAANNHGEYERDGTKLAATTRVVVKPS